MQIDKKLNAKLMRAYTNGRVRKALEAELKDRYVVEAYMQWLAAGLKDIGN